MFASLRRWNRGGAFLGSLVILFSLILQTSAIPASADSAVPVTSRVADFNTGWKFALTNKTGITDPAGAYADAAKPQYHDSAWRSLNLPHDWSIELDPTGAVGTSHDTGFLQGGLGWYRKHFTLPRSLTGKRISVEFDGIYMDSSVYLNGKLLANHPYGYTGFPVDLTSLVHTDGKTPNVLAVQVRNQLPSSRWYSGSGIYRNVHLVVTEPVHVGRHGVFVTTPNLAQTYSAGYGSVHVVTSAVDESGVGARATVISTVRDPAGHEVANGRSAIDLGAQLKTATTDIRVPHPKLWSAANPYLYTLQSDVVVHGRIVDSTSTRFGMRWTKFDPREGFFLNGAYTKIHGVDLHHDQGALGSAVNKDALYRQMQLMKSMGVNALRTSHNPPAPELIQVCEELGIVVMVEAFDTWRKPKVTYDYGRFFDANSDADITEMVNAAKNSPSVILWSIGNEIPDSTSAAVALPIVKRLVSDVKAIDPTRPVVIGSDKYDKVPSDGSGPDVGLRELDGLGLNYNTAGSTDGLHAKYPDKFLFESESSSETSARGVYQDPDQLNTGENYTPGKRATSSYDNNLKQWTASGEYGLKKDRDRKWFAGQFLWAGMDYLGEPTPYSVFPVKTSFFGAMDTAGFPKDMYYLFKSQWTTDPMVHLLPMNWTDHKPGEQVSVWAYSNVDAVELFLNGKSLGTRTFDHQTTTDGRSYLETREPSGDDKNVASGRFPGSYTGPNGNSGKLHLTWTVPFAPGKLVAVATKSGKEVARDRIDTAGTPATVRLTPDKKVITSDGRSLSYITADIVDDHGVVVPGADNLIDFEVTGGKLAGTDNGRSEDAGNYKASSRHAFNGKALAIIGSTASGPVTIRARGAGLEPGTATVWSVKQNRHGTVGVDPVRLRVPVGGRLSLPGQVQIVSADGKTQAADVLWLQASKRISDKPGVTTIKGIVLGADAIAEATVSTYQPTGSDTWSTVVPVGTAPTLPRTVRVVYSDGVDRFLPATWDAVPKSSYSQAGTVNIGGAIAGTGLRTTAQIRVTADFKPGQNLAAATSPARPSADASYSGAPTTLPSALLDGVTNTGGWSNFYSKAATKLLPAVSKAHDQEWVSVGWTTQQTISQLKAYFTTGPARVLPSSARVSYWDGSAWVPVNGLHITWATASNTASIVTFDPVSASAFRLEMTSSAPGSSTGFLQITELEAIGDLLH